MISVRRKRLRQDNIRVEGSADGMGFLQIEPLGDFLDVPLLG